MKIISLALLCSSVIVPGLCLGQSGKRVDITEAKTYGPKIRQKLATLGYLPGGRGAEYSLSLKCGYERSEELVVCACIGELVKTRDGAVAVSVFSVDYPTGDMDTGSCAAAATQAVSALPAAGKL